MDVDFRLSGNAMDIAKALTLLVGVQGVTLQVRENAEGSLASVIGAISGRAEIEDDPAETPATPGRVFMDLPTMRRMLLGSPLNETQVNLLNILYRQTGWMSSPTLQEKLNLPMKSFRGLMGGFGLRVTGNKFAVGETAPIFFDVMKRQGLTYYRLPGRAKQAMRLAGLVQ
ncbi:hypothetical protein ACFOD4_04590 [Pseudoroseomonas globiformis]|uniref:Uncharacterized protein n=1 Tax=Teichococcus globiformis TaxID=2307229 RepID=A0ABV7FZT9_9PROT